jgi:hypothetical protein
VRLHLDDVYDLGAEFFRWEVATAAAGAILGLNPFDEPNVARAKEATNAALAKFLESGRLPEWPTDTADDLARVIGEARVAGRVVGRLDPVEVRVQRRLRVDDDALPARELHDDVGAQDAAVAVGRPGLLDEVAVRDHPGQLDDALQLQFAPAAANPRTLECVRQSARLVAQRLAVGLERRDPLEQLRAGLGAAGVITSDHGDISANEARRLACTAHLIPAVLGSKGEVLDMGHAARLFTPAQRKALRLRDQGCRAEGCTTPVGWCEAHHWDPWSHNGPTNLGNGVLLCNWHHHRAHDNAYAAERLANGDVRFRRRT